MKLKNENKEENNSENKSFFEKLKTDKKYKAKVELTGYAIFIVVLVIFLNISNIGNNYNYSDNNVVSDNEKTEVDIDEENSDLLESLDNNYSYDIKVEVKKGSSDSSQNKDAETVQNQDSDANEKQNNGDADSLGEIKTVSYNGKSYDNNIVINKSFDNNNMTYYKVDKEYYTKDGDKFNVVDINSVYDLLDAKYIEIAGVKEYIEKASLDHYTNYSSGKKEYVYNLKVSDVINSFKGDNLVEIDVIIENDTINVKIDYSNLIKINDDSIIECLVTYVYKDIGKVEEFVIIEEDKEDLLDDGKMNDNQGD